MSSWSPQLYKREAPEGIDPGALANAIAIGKAIVAINSELPPLFTLNHLAHETDVSYKTLRRIVERNEPAAYRTFQIRKKPLHSEERRFRLIAVPNKDLMKVQRWIAQFILAPIAPHTAAVAYAKGSKVYDAARIHASARWLIKIDIRNFFESINELSVYRVFLKMGYQPLVAFELTRMCTRLGSATKYARKSRMSLKRARGGIRSYTEGRMGHLPQGAPTSPMLANLAVYALDERLSTLAEMYGLTYTRYADDMMFSTNDSSWERSVTSSFIGEVYKELGAEGLSPNIAKTVVSSPGARRIVLGLLVDTDTPRLTRQFRSQLRQHLYYLKGVGPVAHAKARGFSSVIGLRNHLFGLAAYARQIEPAYGGKLLAELKSIRWPL